MCIQSAVERRDSSALDAIHATEALAEIASDELNTLIEEIEVRFPRINWFPAYDAIENEFKQLETAHSDLEDHQVALIAGYASCQLSADDALKFTAMELAA